MNNLGCLWIFLLISTKIKDAVGLCSKPITTEYAVLDPSGILKDTFDEASTVRLKCFPGYEPSSASPRTINCLDGQWRPPPGRFTCRKKSCGNPGDVHNGRYEFLEGVEFGAVIRAVCNEGYYMIGDDTRVCMANGEWDGSEPVCEVVKCGPPPTVPNGQPHFPPKDEYEFGQVVQYGCNSGHTLFGDSEQAEMVHCLSNGSWSHHPRCVDVKCSSPSVPHAIRVEGGSEPYGYGATVRYECKDEYRMVSGTGRMVCLEHGWSSSPKCEAVCTNDLGLSSWHIADEKMSASSVLSQNFGLTKWDPHYARLDYSAWVNAWSPATSDHSQWLQVDLGSPKTVTGIITQGAKDFGHIQFVSAFKVAYSNHSSSWTVLDKIYQGNTDNNTHKRNMFNPPFYARFVRFLPLQWHKRITVRMELLGCD